MTRAKAWVRISGISNTAKYFTEELDIAIRTFPYLKFIYPDLEKVETIQCDLNSKEQLRKRAREAYEVELKRNWCRST